MMIWLLSDNYGPHSALICVIRWYRSLNCNLRLACGLHHPTPGQHVSHPAFVDLMVLRPRIDVYVGILLCGIFLAVVGFASAFMVGLYVGILPGLVGVLGSIWVAVGVAGLARRKSAVIVIDSDGITIPTGSVFRIGPSVHIPSEVIATISKDESIRGRLIAVALRTGGKVEIPARNYCGLKKFLRHCKAHGLPTA